MKIYEVTAAGFDGTTDITDDLVFWVTAPDEITVRRAIEDTDAIFRGEVANCTLADADFHLPRQQLALSSALLEKVSNLRNLNRMKS